MSGFESTGDALRPRSTGWTLSSDKKRGSFINCRRIWPLGLAVISRSRLHPQSTATALDFHRYFLDRIATPPPASHLPQASSTAPAAPGRSSPRLSRAPCRPPVSHSTTSHPAPYPAPGGTVMRMRRKRLFVRTPRAIDRQTRKWFSSTILSMAFLFFWLAGRR